MSSWINLSEGANMYVASNKLLGMDVLARDRLWMNSILLSVGESKLAC